MDIKFNTINTPNIAEALGVGPGRFFEIYDALNNTRLMTNNALTSIQIAAKQCNNQNELLLLLFMCGQLSVPPTEKDLSERIFDHDITVLN